MKSPVSRLASLAGREPMVNRQGKLLIRQNQLPSGPPNGADHDGNALSNHELKDQLTEGRMH
ncbi:hypothetical protein M514_09770 [Trichuris suis]|uniref:Uncharacterized protein n=1 Tax=Trichuris suis TaxID=68888 RepID=A0A085NMC5_9BILA|nr:hypothetical protein M513_09770 [Trichuris suis]KFD70621.1 hypothetical protein M514_09770 [Trichuris suis]